MAEYYGFKKIYGFGILLSAVMCFLSPIVAKWNVWGYMVLRGLQGVFTGVTFPSLYAMTARWVPLKERNSFIARSYFGTVFGKKKCCCCFSFFGWFVIIIFPPAIYNRSDCNISHVRYFDWFIWLGICILCHWKYYMYLVCFLVVFGIWYTRYTYILIFSLKIDLIV